jgi:hypothetical protein
VGAAAVLSLLGATTARAADALVPETRTLFLTERFTADSARAPLAGATQPQDLVTMRGEFEGFQLALRNPTGSQLGLSARVTPDSALGAELASGRISIQLLRSGFVRLPRGSTGMGTSGGTYEDPLPPFGTGRAGQLLVDPGAWGGVVLLARVRTDATPGSYAGTLEVVEPGANGELVRARQPFTLNVRGRTLLQSGSPGAFTTVLDVESQAYWLQDAAMRNDSPDRMRQLVGLLSFLDSRGISPRTTPFAAPSARGSYTCAYDSPGPVGAFSFRAQLQARYFGRSRAVNPASRQLRARVMPTSTGGCNPDTFSAAFHATTDPLHTPGTKQDDSLARGAPRFFATVAAAWRASGWFTRATYAFNPFDEPGDATAAQRRTMATQVPAANVALHRAVGRRAKVVLTSWPRDERRRRICRRVSGGKRCTTLSGDAFSNRRMWDGRGIDDVDVWAAPQSRLFGRTTPSILRPYGATANRSRVYANRLAAIRRRAGHETWAYNFFTATRTMPQLTIDAPATDARLQYWVLARDGHTGLFVSNLMLGWGARAALLPGTNLRRKGNPWDEATYFQHRTYGFAAGWGTFIYPGYRPALGLTSEAQRNSDAAVPVTSLRLEGMRDGAEDANLIAMYRARFGSSATTAQLRSIFPGSYRALPRSLGNVVFPAYDDGHALAQRMEARRRAMILRLTS